jgi:hypothetical protein
MFELQLKQFAQSVVKRSIAISEAEWNYVLQSFVNQNSVQIVSHRDSVLPFNGLSA